MLPRNEAALNDSCKQIDDIRADSTMKIPLTERAWIAARAILADTFQQALVSVPAANVTPASGGLWVEWLNKPNAVRLMIHASDPSLDRIWNCTGNEFGSEAPITAPGLLHWLQERIIHKETTHGVGNS